MNRIHIGLNRRCSICFGCCAHLYYTRSPNCNFDSTWQLLLHLRFVAYLAVVHFYQNIMVSHAMCWCRSFGCCGLSFVSCICFSSRLTSSFPLCLNYSSSIYSCSNASIGDGHHHHRCCRNRFVDKITATR